MMSLVLTAATLLFSEPMTGGHPTQDWTACAQPWETTASQCASTIAGGEAGFGLAPLPVAGADQVVLYARRKTTADRNRDELTIASQKLSASAAAGVRGTAWISTWVQTRQSFVVPFTVAVTFLPPPNASSWSGPWLLNDPAHRRWPPEDDMGETTVDAAGMMRVRFNQHWTDAGGKHQVDSCSIVLRRQWLTVTESRTADRVGFTLNGKAACDFPARPGTGDPRQLIVSQQVGGLATATTAATPAFGTQVSKVVVTRP